MKADAIVDGAMVEELYWLTRATVHDGRVTLPSFCSPPL